MQLQFSSRAKNILQPENVVQPKRHGWYQPIEWNWYINVEIILEQGPCQSSQTGRVSELHMHLGQYETTPAIQTMAKAKV